MKRWSISKAKAQLGALVKQVEHGERVLITRHGRPAALLISPIDYESCKETIAIMSDRQLVREIQCGLAALRAHKARFYTVQELFK